MKLAFAEMVGLLAGFDETGAVRRGQLDAVLEDGQGGGLELMETRDGFFEAQNFIVQQEALVALFADEGEGFVQGQFFGDGDGEGNENLFDGVLRVACCVFSEGIGGRVGFGV